MTLRGGARKEFFILKYNQFFFGEGQLLSQIPAIFTSFTLTMLLGCVLWEEEFFRTNITRNIVNLGYSDIRLTLYLELINTIVDLKLRVYF